MKNNLYMENLNNIFSSKDELDKYTKYITDEINRVMGVYTQDARTKEEKILDDIDFKIVEQYVRTKKLKNLNNEKH